MPRMKTPTKISIFLLLFVITAIAVLLYALFHGYFDNGAFEIKQVQWSSTKQVALLAERSDHDALNSYIHFVVIGDHVFSQKELRHAYYSDAVIFAAASQCLSLHWDGANSLVIECSNSSLDASDMDVQRTHVGKVKITYKNIPALK